MKTDRKILTTTVATALALGLAACGGGGSGGGSRPAPTPAPTPTPAPAPAPSTANADLLTLTRSENFTNDAAIGTGSFPLNGAASRLTASMGDFEIQYDAAQDSYTVRGDGFTQVFTDAHLATEDASSRVYERDTGSRSEALLLTSPGTSGALTHQYVGGGLYLNALTGSSAVDATAVAFAYGVETPDGAVPVSGGASYDVAMVGTNGLWSYSGLGTMAVDFMIGDFRITLDVQEIDPDGVLLEGHYPFKAEGELTGANGFSGIFSLDTYEQYRGTLDGRFYGPDAQEVGAAFAGNGHSDSAIVGFILGRVAPTALGPNPSVANLWAEQTYYLDRTTSDYYETNDGTGVKDNIPDGSGGLVLTAKPDSGELEFVDVGSRFSVPIDGGTISADGRFREHDLGGDRFVRIYRAGPDNPELALTYASFAIVDEVRYRDTDLGTYRMRTYVPFGTPTLVRPTLGIARYRGIVEATGTSQFHVYDLTGGADISVNFGADTFQGSLELNGTEAYTGALVSIAPISFAGYLDYELPSFQGQVYTDWSAGVEGYLFGNFFGPDASELMAVLQGVTSHDPLARGRALDISGVIVARRD